MAMPMATCLSWTWQSPHTSKKTGSSKTLNNLTSQTEVESYRLPMCSTQELESIIRTFLIK